MAGADSQHGVYLPVNPDAVKTAAAAVPASLSASFGAGGGGGAVALAEIGRRYGAELTEAGLRLRAAGEAAVAKAQSKAETVRAEAEALAKELKTALEDLAPLPAERLAKRDVLESLSEGAAVLAAGFLGAFAGRVLGDGLGLVLSTPLALLSAFVLIPAVFAVYGGGLSGKERRLALVETGALMGLACGVATRALPVVAYLPPAAGLIGAAVLGLGGAQLAALGDRRAVLGAVAGAGLALEIGVGVVLGGLSFSGLLLSLLVGAVAAAQIQLALAGSAKTLGLAPVLGLAVALAAQAAIAASLPVPAPHQYN